MKKNSYNATIFLASALVLISSLNALSCLGQDRKTALQQNPKLIIGIAVDQLRTDYIKALQSKLGEKGLKKLMNEGLVYENVSFDLDNIDATAALAVLATGSYPFYNGITSATVYNQDMLRKQSIFFDQQFIGNSTSGHYSPKALIGTNLADELKAASSNLSKVYSIAPNAEEAIIGAGHTGDCAIWLDDKTGKWASTTYYRDFPQYVVRQNYDTPLFVDEKKATWTPVYYGGNIDIMPYSKADLEAFSHSFVKDRRIAYPWIKTSPLINKAITELSKQFLKQGRLGLNGSTDMLQLTFYAGTFQHENAEQYSAELQDIYVRLDQNIEDLLKAVDSSVGLHNTVIYLTGTGNTENYSLDITETVAGEFVGSRCTALLNSYLISLYGQGSWVDTFQDNQVYLNQKTIESKNLKLSEVQRAAAEFVMMFSGVSDVVSAQQLLHEDNNERLVRLRNNYNKVFGGDLLVELQPGWTLKNDDSSQAKHQVRHDFVPGPAIIFAPSVVTPKHISAHIDATEVSPTIAKTIRIRAPSGCRKLPLY